nr:MAG TPA: hypothetical protein [Caudoviricetes sp.]
MRCDYFTNPVACVSTGIYIITLYKTCCKPCNSEMYGSLP